MENVSKLNRIYLDDIRTPIDKDWLIVRDYYQFINLVSKLGLDSIEVISLDHDLGDTAIQEYYNNVKDNYKIDYNNIVEKTGYDVAKWLVEHFYDKNPDRLDMSRLNKKEKPINFPKVVVHSANPIGSGNIMGYINNFLMNEGQTQTCVRVEIKHTV